jgi:hypothetical protein
VPGGQRHGGCGAGAVAGRVQRPARPDPGGQPAGAAARLPGPGAPGLGARCHVRWLLHSRRGATGAVAPVGPQVATRRAPPPAAAQVLSALPGLAFLDGRPLGGPSSGGGGPAALWPMPLPAKQGTAAAAASAAAAAPAALPEPVLVLPKARLLEPLERELPPLAGASGPGSPSGSASRVASAGSSHTRPASASSYGAGAAALGGSWAGLASGRPHSGGRAEEGAPTPRRPGSSLASAPALAGLQTSCAVVDHYLVR